MVVSAEEARKRVERLEHSPQLAWRDVLEAREAVEAARLPHTLRSRLLEAVERVEADLYYRTAAYTLAEEEARREEERRRRLLRELEKPRWLTNGYF